MMMPNPQVARIASSGREYSGFMTRRSMIIPQTKPMAKAHGTDHHGFSPSLVISSAEYPPTVRKPPWAKLMIFITPNTISSPAATLYRIAAVVRMSSSVAMRLTL